MSHKSVGRDIMDAKLAGVQDAALRLALLMKSPYRKHRKAAVAMGELVNKMQSMIGEQREVTVQEPVEA